MANNVTKGQSFLEKAGIKERNEEIVRSIYNVDDEYSAIHDNAKSNGDVKGKGTGNGTAGAWLPDHSSGEASNAINYSNFDTQNGGGLYDIKGRNDIGGREKNVSRMLYNRENQYGPNLVNTEENIALGQFYIK